jgi:hypothetical protein
LRPNLRGRLAILRLGVELKGGGNVRGKIKRASLIVSAVGSLGAAAVAAITGDWFALAGWLCAALWIGECAFERQARKGGD